MLPVTDCWMWWGKHNKYFFRDMCLERVISYEKGKALAESGNTAFLESCKKPKKAAFGGLEGGL